MIARLRRLLGPARPPDAAFTARMRAARAEGLREIRAARGSTRQLRHRKQNFIERIVEEGRHGAR